ncbi:hypothetical protein GGS21DRAFT_362468 [Xylaria nigripes]|nr:hypothetical protein GGS21DRAFT_362468 [Xylaria nigripes]
MSSYTSSRSIDSGWSIESDESYTTRVLASVKREEEYFHQLTCRGGYPHSHSSTSSTGYDSDHTVTKHYHTFCRSPSSSTSTQRCHYPYESPMSSSPDERSWIINRCQSPERPRRKWFDDFTDIWHSVLICLGLKSVSGPD